MDAGLKAYEQGRYAEAEKVFLAAIAETSFGPRDMRLAKGLNNLGALYSTQRKYAVAEPLFKRSLSISEKALGPEHPYVADSLENYARLLRETGREGEAHRLEARAKAIRAKHYITKSTE